MTFDDIKSRVDAALQEKKASLYMEWKNETLGGGGPDDHGTLIAMVPFDQEVSGYDTLIITASSRESAEQTAYLSAACRLGIMFLMASDGGNGL